MTDYANGKNVLLKRPEPGRPVHPIIKQEIQNLSIDTNAIADAVIKAIVNKMPLTTITGIQTKTKNEDNFDDSESLKRLADIMSSQENKEKSNLEGLGNVKEVKKDQKEVNKSIDMLSKLGD